jgi:CheY-like chemotaxis protein
MTILRNTPEPAANGAGQAAPEGFPESTGWLPGLQRRSILVVEDEPLIRRLLVSVLSAEGYRTESVADGTLALRILQDESEIDLVLTDLSMPGLPGTAVAEYLAAYRPEVKVICMSGDPNPHDPALARLLEKRLADFMPKPFTPSQVLQLIRRHLLP